MSTALSSGAPVGELPKVENMRVAIVTAEWNGHITNALTQGALDVFESQGFNLKDDVEVFYLTGAV